MATETQTQEAPRSSQALAAITRQVEERGIKPFTWNTLSQTLYPGASPSSVLMVWDYCMSRNLDPMKKPVHIVPMRTKIGNQWVDRDTVLPGIYEYRTTAHRTGEYLGHDKPIYGPEIEAFGVKAPSTCEYTVYRWNEKAKLKVAYTVELKFIEACGTKKEYDEAGKPTGKIVANGRWERAPFQMLTKCAEAAALREAFPEEIGGIPTMEEIEDHMPETIDATILPSQETIQIPTNWSKVAEGLRDNVEKAFGELKLTPAQRLAKVNEFVKTGSDEEAEALLQWCRAEFAAQKGRVYKAPENSNKKKVDKPADSDPVAKETTTAAPVQETAPEVTDGEVITSAQIPFASTAAKANGKGGKKDLSEMF